MLYMMEKSNIWQKGKGILRVKFLKINDCVTCLYWV